MSMSFDASELRSFAGVVGRARSGLVRALRPVVERGALNVKNQLQEEMAASRHFKGAAGSISYTVYGREAFGSEQVEAEIGPDKSRRGGALANIAYFGTSRGGGTVPDPQGALDAETPHFERALGDVLEELL